MNEDGPPRRPVSRYPGAPAVTDAGGAQSDVLELTWPWAAGPGHGQHQGRGAGHTLPLLPSLLSPFPRRQSGKGLCWGASHTTRSGPQAAPRCPTPRSRGDCALRDVPATRGSMSPGEQAWARLPRQPLDPARSRGPSPLCRTPGRASHSEVRFSRTDRAVRGVRGDIMGSRILWALPALPPFLSRCGNPIPGSSSLALSEHGLFPTLSLFLCFPQTPNS